MVDVVARRAIAIIVKVVARRAVAIVANVVVRRVVIVVVSVIGDKVKVLPLPPIAQKSPYAYFSIDRKDLKCVVRPSSSGLYRLSSRVCLLV
jgi:hypothetical protein